MRHALAGQWWAAVPPEHWPEDPEAVAALRAEWAEPYGDRRQELVFIGQNVDEARLRAELDACLLSDAELAAGPEAWRRYPDAFPAWFEGGR